MTNPIRIDHNTIKEQFLEHLSDPENKRILFSGPFGTGKSTFLKDFFSDKTEEFIYFSIYPVNYSVASNEDIFELIKYDLLIDIIENYSDQAKFNKEEFSLLLTSQVFIQHKMKFLPILTALLSFAGSTGKSVAELIKVMSHTIADFKKFKKEMEVDELEWTKTYLSAFENTKGSMKERDDTSNLILELINRIKESRDEEEKTNAPEDQIKEKNNPDVEKKKIQSILIIDDLDRLDPEHIFRLFNVFSAHYDGTIENNKFGFDKIIFVCDVDNIKKIFDNRYGQDVEFTGYINKFYSKDVFEFDNRKFIREKIGDLMNHMSYSSQQIEDTYSLNDKKSLHFRYAVEWLICSMIDAREINLRALINKTKAKIGHPDCSFSIFHYPYYAVQFELLVLLHLIKEFFPSYSILEVKLKRLTEQPESILNNNLELNSCQDRDGLKNLIINYTLPFILPREIMFKDNKQTKSLEDKQKPHFVEDLNVYVHYFFKDKGRHGNNKPHITRFTSEGANDSAETDVDLYKLLYYAFVKCKKEGYLK